MKDNFNQYSELKKQAEQKLAEGCFDEVRAIAFGMLNGSGILNSENQAETLLLIGNSYFNNSQYHKALDYYNQAEVILLELNDDKKLIPCLVNKAIIFNNLEQFDLAIENYKKAFRYIDDTSLLQKAQMHNGIGNVLNKQKNFAEALKHFRKVLKYAQLAESNFGLAMAWRNIAACQVDLQDYKKAKVSAKKAISIASEYDFATLYIGAIQSLAEALIETGQQKKGLDLLQNTLNDLKCLNETYNLRYHYLLMYKAAKMLRNFEQSLQYFESWSELNNQMLSSENTRLVNELFLQFETDKKDKAINQLQLENKEQEIQRLKSQINPHFVFNALGSIKSLIARNETQIAATALDSFAFLMRQTLQQSQKDWIPISKEMEFLKNYIQLESLQFGNDFTFSISVDEDVYGFEIPSLLLQPIVENSIKHGLFHKKGKKILKIDFRFLNDNAYKVRIIDNGVGRIFSSEINKNRINHESFASKSVEKRMELIQEIMPVKISYKVKDLYDKSGEPTGTETLFTFKFQD